MSTLAHSVNLIKKDLKAFYSANYIQSPYLVWLLDSTVFLSWVSGGLSSQNIYRVWILGWKRAKNLTVISYFFQTALVTRKYMRCIILRASLVKSRRRKHSGWLFKAVLFSIKKSTACFPKLPSSAVAWFALTGTNTASTPCVCCFFSNFKSKTFQNYE